MGISSAMNAGVMGLNVNSSKLSTISDNIANSETKGYKRANVEFNSLVLTERPTSYDAGGVRASTIREINDQGALLSTRNELDLAISGRGFFAVTDIADVRRNVEEYPLKLTRTGSFRPDENGILGTNSGLALLGFAPDADGNYPDNALQTDLVEVKLDALSLAAERTSNISMKLNLNADAIDGSVFQPPIQYFDTLGRTQQLDFRFTKTTAANVWDLQLVVPGATPPEQQAYQIEFETNPTLGKPGGIKDVQQYADPADLTSALAAPSNWTVDAAAPPAERGLLKITPPGGAELSISLGYETDDSGIVQFSTGNQLLTLEKDGSPASQLVGVEVDETGLLDFIYDSGFRKNAYKIPIMNVPNPNGMRALDGQAFMPTRASGVPNIYDPGEGPVGLIVSSALEESTTDIAEELTQLIKTQRAYSSNAKIIQTVDEMLQETTNLKR